MTITCLSIPAYFRLSGGNHGGKKSPAVASGAAVLELSAMENEREVLVLQHQVKGADEQGQAPRYRPGDALNPIVIHRGPNLTL